MRKAHRMLGFMFDEVLPDPEGTILISARKLGEYALSVRGGLKAGSCYTPGFHERSCEVVVLAGTGDFLLGAQAIPYSKGSSFKISAQEAHSFVKVITDTVFIKTIRLREE